MRRVEGVGLLREPTVRLAHLPAHLHGLGHEHVSARPYSFDAWMVLGGAALTRFLLAVHRRVDDLRLRAIPALRCGHAHLRATRPVEPNGEALALALGLGRLALGGPGRYGCLCGHFIHPSRCISATYRCSVAPMSV